MNNQILIYFNMFTYAKFVNEIQHILKERHGNRIHSIGPAFCAINCNREKTEIAKLLIKHLPNTLIKYKCTFKHQRKYTIIQSKN